MTSIFVPALPQSVREKRTRIGICSWDRAILLMTQTLQVVQGRTPNHLDLLNLKWTLVCRNPSSWSSSYREGARERYQAYNRPSEKRVRTKHGPGVHGTTLWTRSMDRVHGPPVMDRVILGDPGAVSRAGRKGATKVFKHRRKSPLVPTLTGPFPKGQANAASWLGTKNALYYFLYVSLPSLHDCHMRIPDFTFCERRKQAMTKFSFSLWTWIWLIEIQLQRRSLAFDKVSELE